MSLHDFVDALVDYMEHGRVAIPNFVNEILGKGVVQLSMVIHPPLDQILRFGIEVQLIFYIILTLYFSLSGGPNLHMYISYLTHIEAFLAVFPPVAESMNALYKTRHEASCANATEFPRLRTRTVLDINDWQEADAPVVYHREFSTSMDIGHSIIRNEHDYRAAYNDEEPHEGGLVPHKLPLSVNTIRWFCQDEDPTLAKIGHYRVFLGPAEAYNHWKVIHIDFRSPYGSRGHQITPKVRLLGLADLAYVKFQFSITQFLS
jgi:hypothetical protein